MKDIQNLLEVINKLKVAQKHRTMLFYIGMMYLLLQGTAWLIIANQIEVVAEKFINL
jgi:hypothetical protein